MNAENKYWSDAIKLLTPYVPGEQVKGRKVTRLNTNENPYPPSPQVTQSILKALGDNAEQLRLYPSFDMHELKTALANYHHVNPDQIFIGNGSDEILGHVFNALFRRALPVLMPDISYSFYPVYSQLFGIPTKKIPLHEDFSIHVDDYLTPENQANAGIIIANPNAPTGIELPASESLKLIQHNQQSAVVIDEAYVDYGAETVIPYIKDYKNLLVVRTFSKSRSLAGLRIGYAIGDSSLIQALNCVKDSFNSFPVDTLAQVAAIASIHDEAYFQQCRINVIKTREWLVTQLEKLGFSILPSTTNFLFVSTQQKSASELYNSLREKNILVRHFKQPRIENYLRISIGTQQESEELVRALQELLS